MATAMCVRCAKGCYFTGHRGIKLADFSCQCGGKLTAAAWTPAGYVPRSPDKRAAIAASWLAADETWDGYAKTESFGRENYK